MAGLLVAVALIGAGVFGYRHPSHPKQAWAERPAVRVFVVWAGLRAYLIYLFLSKQEWDAILGLTNEWAQSLLGTLNPYEVQGGVGAYPPLAMVLFSVVGLFARTNEQYEVAFIGMILVIDLAALWFATSMDRREQTTRATWVWVIVPALIGPLLWFARYDMVVAVVTLIAVILWLRGRTTGAWWWMGIALALKPYVAVLVPIWLIYEQAPRACITERARAVWRRLPMILIPTAVGILLLTPVAGLDWWNSYGFQASRPFTVDSLPATVLAFLSEIGVGDSYPKMSNACACLSRFATYDHILRPVSALALCLSLLGLYRAVWRRRYDATILPSASLCAISLLLLLYPVYSVQYVIWLIPFITVVLVRRHRTSVQLLGAAVVASQWSAYPLYYVSIAYLEPIGIALLVVKPLLLVAIVIVCLAQIRSVSTTSSDAGQISAVAPGANAVDNHAIE